MNKQIKKLNLNKKTISNLSSTEMSEHIGGLNTNDNNKALLHPPFTKKCRPSW